MSIIVYDTETTGFNPDEDDILQLSIMDFDENVLFNSYIKPRKKKMWTEAMAVNHIHPYMVADAPTFDEVRDEIQRIFNSADLLVAYNNNFDNCMLTSHGINNIFQKPKFDVMMEFAKVYGEINEKYSTPEHPCYKWQKLTTCAAYYGYEFNAHDSLEDVRATLYCYKKMLGFI